MDKKYNQKVKEIEEKFDPLNVLPQEVLDVIFGHLRTKDLLDLSLASWSWYNTIGRAECMKKMKIRYEHNESKDLESLLSSSRQYQNICVEYYDDTENRLTVENEVKNILKKFASSIKSIETPIDFQRVCDLPKLKTLVYDFSSFNYIFDNRGYRKSIAYSSGLFSRLQFVEELKVINSDEKLEKFIRNYLFNMSNLKVLEVAGNIFDGTKCNFNLRKLTSSASGDNYLDFVEFLKSQSDTLEDLSICVSLSSLDDILTTVLTMPNLKKFAVSTFFNEVFPKNLPINNTIKFFKTDSSVFHGILAFLKNLQVLKVSVLSTNLLEAVLSCPSLRKIKYYRFDNGERGGDNPINNPVSDFWKERYPNIQFIISSYYY